MRTWVYCYKTSDGLRHEGEMHAPSKDDAYAELRQQGIRAIRVTERIRPLVKRGFGGLRRRDWFSLAVMSCGIVFLVAYIASRGIGTRSEKDVGHFPVLMSGGPEHARLVAEAQGVLVAHKKRIEAIDRELLSNYALVYRSLDLSELQAEIEKGRTACADARQSLREVFKQYYELIPIERNEERLDAQRIYGALVEAIESDEECLDGDECAIELLATNRGKWSVRKGRVVWTDADLEAQFKMYGRESVGGTFRWQRDFGPVRSVITSQVIRVESPRQEEKSSLKKLEIPH